MTDNDLKDILNFLVQEVSVLKVETLHNSALIVGICQQLHNRLNVDLRKLNEDAQTPEATRLMTKKHEKISRQVKSILEK